MCVRLTSSLLRLRIITVLTTSLKSTHYERARAHPSNFVFAWCRYFNALEGGAIPIVLYGEWYDQFAPLKGRSFIRASDFASPKALAEYIKK